MGVLSTGGRERATGFAGRRRFLFELDVEFKVENVSITFRFYCGSLQAFKRNLRLPFKLWDIEAEIDLFNVLLWNSSEDPELMNAMYFAFRLKRVLCEYFFQFFSHSTSFSKSCASFRSMCGSSFYVSCVFGGQCIKKQHFPTFPHLIDGAEF